MDPDFADLKKHTSLLKDLATKTRENCFDLVKKVVGLWVDLCAAACSLISANATMQQIADGGHASLKQFFLQDGMTKLINVKSLRKKVTVLTNKINATRPDDSDGSMDALFSLEIPQAFQTELSRESVDDVCSFGVSQATNAFENLMKEFETEVLECRKKKDPDGMDAFEDKNMEYFLQWSAGQDGDWRRLVTNDMATREELLRGMRDTIFKIPASQTQTFKKDVWEARC